MVKVILDSLIENIGNTAEDLDAFLEVAAGVSSKRGKATNKRIKEFRETLVQYGVEFADLADRIETFKKSS